MSFTSLLYHEIRESKSLEENHRSPIQVKQNYEDLLPTVLFVALENFTEQLQYLRHHNYHSLTLNEVIDYYYNGKKIPDKSVLISFDDCFQSLLHYAYPLLKQHGFHAVAFVVTGWLNDQSKPFDTNHSVCLSTKELDSMTDVFEYANHTHSFHTRQNLTTNKAMVSTDLDFSNDLDYCNTHPIITAPQVFAYTFGLFNDANVSVLKEKDFKLAFTTEQGKNTHDTNPLLLRRNVIPYFMDLPTFKHLLTT